MAAHQRMIDQLQALYGAELVQAGGQTYPVIFFPADKPAEVDALLTPDYPTQSTNSADFALYDEGHLRSRQQTRSLTNGLCYAFDALSTEPLQISAKLGHYFDMIATGDALDHEMRDFARGERTDTPLRDALHAKIPPADVIRSGGGRSGVIGGAAVVIYNTAAGYRVLIGQRTAQAGTGAGLYHVVPAFIFQPSGPEAFFAGEWSFAHHVLREFGEELFAMPEYDDWPGADHVDYFYTHPAIADLRAMLADERAHLHATGIAINLLSLRPELCAVLVIHDAGWQQRWERELTAAQHTERQETRLIPLDTLAGLPEDVHLRMAPHGAVAMWTGINHARRLIR